MTKIKLLALLLILAFAISAFVACDLVAPDTQEDETEDTAPDGGDTEGGDENNPADDNNQKPGDDNGNKPGDDDVTGDTPGDDTPTVCTHEWVNGVCTKCQTVCSHDFDPDNDYTCTNCGIQALVPPSPKCEHEWSEGVCTKCGEECAHVWDNGYCPICTEKCVHIFDGDTCTVCGFVELPKPPVTECNHTWQDGYCPLCGNSCQHTYSDSVCTECGMACEHNYTGGYCGYCGKACEHIWNGNYCEICHFTCMHEGSWSNGSCSVCGNVCNHSWNLTQCENCGLICNHEFDTTTCIHCGYVSLGIDNPLIVTYEDMQYYIPYSATFHDFLHLCIYIDYEESLALGYWVVVTEEGDVDINDETFLYTFGREMTVAFRTYSFVECTHTWHGGVCLDCGQTCDHVWENGKCIVCSLTCTHRWSDEGSCYVCGTYCSHTWSNGSCLVCGKECLHDVRWHEGICVICYMQCEHSWLDVGYCSKCGMECDHSYIPEGHCSVCHNPCGHSNWTDGVCDKCQRVCTHLDMYEGVCNMCGYKETPAGCDHGWADGVCMYCGEVCSHEYENATCTICGFMPIYIWYNGSARHVSYEYTFLDFIEYEGIDFYETSINNVWRVICYDNDMVYEITDPNYFRFCDYGRSFTIVCEAKYPDYVNFNMVFYYWRTWEWGYNEYGWEIMVPCDPILEHRFDKYYMAAGSEMHNTLGNFLAEFVFMDDAELDLYNFDWYLNGELLSESDLIPEGAYLVAIEKTHYQDLSTNISFSVEGLGIGANYHFPCPIDPNYASELFVKEYGIDTDLYEAYFSYLNEGMYDNFIYGNITVTYKMKTRTITVYAVDNVTHPLIIQATYPITYKTTVREYLASLGINADDYLVFDYSACLIDPASDSFFTLYLLEKNKAEDEITINIKLKESEYSDYVYGSIVLDTPITLEILTNMDFVDDNGYLGNIPGFYSCYAYIINGEMYCPYIAKEHLLYFIYTDAEIEIVPCYPISVEFTDVLTGEYVQETFVFLTPPSGQDVIDKLERNMRYYTPRYSWSNYEYDMFLTLTFYEHCTIRFEPNKVCLDVYFTDEWGHTNSERIEESYSINLLYVLENLENCKFILYYPDGTSREITKEEAITIYFDPDNAESNDNYYYHLLYTFYKLEVINDSFIFDLSVDGQTYESKTFSKSDNLTFREILMSYGINYDDYEWSCMNDGGIILSADYIPSDYINAYGYNIRPRLEVRLNNSYYYIYHEYDLTLGDAIDMLNNKYGLGLVFEEYMWYIDDPNDWYNKTIAVNDLGTVIANMGMTSSLDVKLYNKISVSFGSDFGPITDDGMCEVVFTKGDKWQAPTIREGLAHQTYDIIYFTGEFEYRVYDDYYNVIETITITSLDDLFALRLERVDLYAKYEIDYARLCGTYVTDQDIYKLEGNTIYVYRNGEGKVMPAMTYSVKVEGSWITIVDEYGYYITDGMHLQEGFKVNDSDFYAVVVDPFGSSPIFCCSYSEYLSATENYEVTYISDICENQLYEVGECGIYFVYTAEKQEIYE